ncbi:hypothetical protein AAULR_19566, partial [Lacticaseibacillus rhamnosus MTCC 5462]
GGPITAVCDANVDFDDVVDAVERAGGKQKKA